MDSECGFSNDLRINIDLALEFIKKGNRAGPYKRISHWERVRVSAAARRMNLNNRGG